MSLTFTAGGTSLPMPRQNDPYKMEYIPFGSASRALSGALRVQFIASRWKIDITWEGLTKTERDSLFTVYNTYLSASGTWIFPDGKTLTGMVAMGSWSESQWHQINSGNIYYDISFTVEEV